MTDGSDRHDRLRAHVAWTRLRGDGNDHAKDLSNDLDAHCALRVAAQAVVENPENAELVSVLRRAIEVD